MGLFSWNGHNLYWLSLAINMDWWPEMWLTFILSDLFNFLAFFFAPLLNWFSALLLFPGTFVGIDSSASDPSSFRATPPDELSDIFADSAFNDKGHKLDQRSQRGYTIGRPDFWSFWFPLFFGLLVTWASHPKEEKAQLSQKVIWNGPWKKILAGGSSLHIFFQRPFQITF